MSPDRKKVEAWWRSPVASMTLVLSGLTVIFIEVGLGDRGSALGFSTGLALVGLGVTGRIQNWAIGGGSKNGNGSSDDEEKKP